MEELKLQLVHDDIVMSLMKQGTFRRLYDAGMHAVCSWTRVGENKYIFRFTAVPNET